MKKSDFHINNFDYQQDVINTALGYLNTYKDEVLNHQVMVVVDMTQPSYKKRFWLYDIAKGRIIRQHHVAHGKNSNSKTDRAMCKYFSNKWMSKKSSKGCMYTGNVYYGKHGRSLNLHGLQPGVNDNVYKRRIVVHKARYVTDSFILRNHRAGNSWGCLALDPAICNTIINIIKDGVFVYVHGH